MLPSWHGTGDARPIAAQTSCRRQAVPLASFAGAKSDGCVTWPLSVRCHHQVWRMTWVTLALYLSLARTARIFRVSCAVGSGQLAPRVGSRARCRRGRTRESPPGWWLLPWLRSPWSRPPRLPCTRPRFRRPIAGAPAASGRLDGRSASPWPRAGNRGCLPVGDVRFSIGHVGEGKRALLLPSDAWRYP